MPFRKQLDDATSKISWKVLRIVSRWSTVPAKPEQSCVPMFQWAQSPILYLMIWSEMPLPPVAAFPVAGGPKL